MNRAKALTKELFKEVAKRIPYILVVLGIILLVQGYHNTQIARDNSTDTKTLLNKVASLSEDNKRLSKENQALSKQGILLAQQNSAHIDCVKQLFVDYINSGQQISSADADKCTVNSLPGSYFSPPESNNETTTPQKSPNPKSKTTKPSHPSEPTPQPNLLQRTLDNITDFLGGLL